MSSTGRFTVGLICGSVVFFLLTGVQFARQQSSLGTTNVSHRQDDKAKKSAEYSSPIIRVLSKVVEKTKDLEGSDRDTALDILRKADPLLKKIREENRKALQRINSPVRLRGGRAPKNKAVEIRSAI